MAWKVIFFTQTEKAAWSHLGDFSTSVSQQLCSNPQSIIAFFLINRSSKVWWQLHLVSFWTRWVPVSTQSSKRQECSDGHSSPLQQGPAKISMNSSLDIILFRVCLKRRFPAPLVTCPVHFLTRFWFPQTAPRSSTELTLLLTLCSEQDCCWRHL